MSRLADILARRIGDASSLRLVAGTLTVGPADDGFALIDFGDGEPVSCLLNPDLALTVPGQVLVLVDGPLRYVAFRAPEVT